MSALARFSPSTAEASAWASLIRMSRSAAFTSASRWKPAVCSPTFCCFLQFGDADRLLAHGVAGADLADLVGVGHADRLFALGLGHADLAHPLVVGHVAAGFLDGLRGRLLADGLDIARLVGDVGDVDVDQHQADLSQFRFERVLDGFQELVAVAVDVLDLHRGDHLAKLAEDHVFGLLLDFLVAQAQQADGRVLHLLGRGADGHGEHAGHVDADVLHRQGAAQRDLDLHRLEAQPGVVLDQRPDELRPAVDATGRVVPAARLAVDHQHAVARAAFVLLHQQHE